MAHAAVHPPFPIWFGLWFLVSIGSAAFFRRSRSAAFKRRVWAPFLVVCSVVFVGIVWAIGRRVETLYVAVPAVVLLTLVNLRTMRFCDGCGATVRGTAPWRAPAYCPTCGRALAR